MWQSSGLTWEAVLPADRVADFIKDKKLEFLQGAAASTSPAPSQANQDRTISDLTKMIKEGKSSADIHSYINVSFLSLSWNLGGQVVPYFLISCCI